MFSVTALRSAMIFLTRVPVGTLREWPASAAATAVWFPAVGILIGASVGMVSLLANSIWPYGIAAILGVTTWALITGGLHLDGVADLGDASTAMSEPERARRVMKDPRVGAHGVLALLLLLALKIAAWSLCVGSGDWTAAIYAAGGARLGSVFSMAVFPALAGESLAASFHRDVTLAHAIVVGGVSALVFVVLGMTTRALTVTSTGLVGATVPLALGGWATYRLGGVNGDVHGAGIELGEVASLLTWVAIFDGATHG